MKRVAWRAGEDVAALQRPIPAMSRAAKPDRTSDPSAAEARQLAHPGILATPRFAAHGTLPGETPDRNTEEDINRDER